MAPGAAATTMSDYQKETTFLRRCLRFEDTVEHSDLAAAITRLQLNERCVYRAAWLMALFTALALTGLGYVRIMQIDHQSAEPFVIPLLNRILQVLGAGSLICLVSFGALGLANRRELNERREQGRRLVAKLMDSRMGEPMTPSWDRQNLPDQGRQAAASRVVEAGHDGHPPRTSTRPARSLAGSGIMTHNSVLR